MNVGINVQLQTLTMADVGDLRRFAGGALPPIQIVDDVVHHRLGDAKRIGQLAMGRSSSAVGSPYSIRLGRIKLRAAVAFAAQQPRVHAHPVSLPACRTVRFGCSPMGLPAGVAALPMAVLRIIHVGPQEQMRWTTTDRVVATMQAIKPIGYGAGGYLPGQAVRLIGVPIELDSPVAHRPVASSGPYPTVSGFFDMRPEIGDLIGGKIRMHDVSPVRWCHGVGRCNAATPFIIAGCP